jgi:hypothetical protein
VAPERQPRATARPGTAPEIEPLHTEPGTEHDDPAARITEAITGATEAARHFAKEQASRQARSEYTTRICRQAEAQPEAHATPAAEAPADVEMEL